MAILQVLQHDLTTATAVAIHYTALIVLVSTLLNAGLPSALTDADKTTDKNELARIINKIRRNKYYGKFRRLISLGAVAVAWATNATDPKQRDAVNKMVAPLLSLLAAASAQAGIDDTSTADAASTDTTDTTSPPKVATLLTAPSPTTGVQYTLSGPVLAGLSDIEQSIINNAKASVK